MKISKDTVFYVAELSRLKVYDHEIDDLCDGLSSILSYVNEINSSINTDSVVSEVVEKNSIMREDEVFPSFNRSSLLSNAPEKTEGTPVVPKTVD